MTGPKLTFSRSNRHDWPVQPIESSADMRKLVIISHQSKTFRTEKKPSRTNPTIYIFIYKYIWLVHIGILVYCHYDWYNQYVGWQQVLFCLHLWCILLLKICSSVLISSVVAFCCAIFYISFQYTLENIFHKNEVFALTSICYLWLHFITQYLTLLPKLKKWGGGYLHAFIKNHAVV